MCKLGEIVVFKNLYSICNQYSPNINSIQLAVIPFISKINSTAYTVPVKIYAMELFVCKTIEQVGTIKKITLLCTNHLPNNVT